MRRTLGWILALNEEILSNVDLVVTNARTDDRILNNVVVNALGSLQRQFKTVARKTCCMLTIMASMGVVQLGR